MSIIVNTLIGLVQWAVINEPALAKAIGNILNSSPTTVTDLDTLRGHVAGQTYENLVPNSDIPKQA